MYPLILFSLYSNDLLKYKNCVIKKHAFREVLLIKKNVIYKEIVICKEKAGTVTKVKLVTKIKKHNQLYFGTLVIVIVEITHKMRTYFKTLASKKVTTWRLKKSQNLS